MKILSIIVLMVSISCSKTKEIVNNTANIVKDAGQAVVDTGANAVDTVAQKSKQAASAAVKVVKPSSALIALKLSPESSIGFKVLKFAKLSEVQGKFNKFQGTARYDGVKISNILTAIFANSIETDSPDRDKELKTAAWFEVDKHPVIAFTTSSAVELAPSFDLPGEIQIKGVKKPITLKAKTISQDANGVVIEATGVVNRTDFGLDWNKPLEKEVTFLGQLGKVAVAEEVTLSLKLVAKANAK